MDLTPGPPWQASVPGRLADDLDLWEPRYGVFDRDRSLRQLAAIARLPGTDGAAVERTAAQLATVFDQWEARTLGPSFRPQFAFLAPTRVRRGDPTHAAEAVELCPPLGAHPDLAPLLMAGVPPFAIDRYGLEGPGGICLYTPLLAELATDLPLDAAVATMHAILRSTLTFARDVGVRVAGLAATLPSLTDFGRSIRTEGILTTTGHAGTVAVIVDLVDRLVADGSVIAGRRPWGLLGCGSIGSAIAHALADRHPAWPLLLADASPDQQERVDGDLRRAGFVLASPATSSELLGGCDLVVSAVTTRVDLDALGVGSLEGTVVIDDSQPSCFDLDRVAGRGGRLLWPLAFDVSTSGAATRQGIDGREPFAYGGPPIGLASPSALFGCEAEVATLGTLDRLDLALDRAVRPADVAQVQELFGSLGIWSAPVEHCER